MRKVIKAFITLLITIIIIPSITHSEDIKLIVRGDDMGMTQGSLVAFEKAFNEGILTCGSILVYAPWFEAAAKLSKKNPGWCVGVHLGLVGEWRGYRWRPILPWNKVSSLVDEGGFLYTPIERKKSHLSYRDVVQQCLCVLTWFFLISSPSPL